MELLLRPPLQLREWVRFLPLNQVVSLEQQEQPDLVT
jgi:hypothetical protein